MIGEYAGTFLAFPSPSFGYGWMYTFAVAL